MSDTKNVFVSSNDDILPMLVVTRSAAKAAEVQSLVIELGDGTHSPLPCPDPVDPATQLHLLSLFTTGDLSGSVTLPSDIDACQSQ